MGNLRRTLAFILLLPVLLFTGIHISEGEWTDLLILWVLYGLTLFVIDVTTEGVSALLSFTQRPRRYELHPDPTRPDRARESLDDHAGMLTTYHERNRR